ncbi:MAG: hypothetical protein V4724_26115 [Pseudomonadota bacterium]
MAELQRITTQYIAVEDRVRLAGKTDSDTPVVMWLTQRLLARMVPVLLRWLESNAAGAFQPAIAHGFAQHAARAGLRLSEPVLPAANSMAWLVSVVDVAQSSLTMQLTFKGGDDERIDFILEAQPLRQWLAILHNAYRQAEWPFDIWPDWINDKNDNVLEPGTVLH